MSLPTARRDRKTVRLLRPLLGAVLVLSLAAAGGAATALDKHDTKKPVEIDADSLEIQQDKKVAVFTGNVAARQGELVLRADRLTVDYGDEKRVEAGAAPEISKLRARGKVHLVSPGESARGDWAVYDVPQRRITMGGDVVLTRGENVLQGRHLTFNLATGQSRIEGGSGATASAESKSGRVRAVFNPAAADSGG